jgi:multimeric flavodoxin WrbA
MGAIIYAASPNRDGLTAECVQAASDGIADAGGSVEVAYLNDLDIGLCQACDRGWGTCHESHYCQVEDGFQALHESTKGADAFVIVSPVYFGEMSESAKAFFDRLRRCEATRGNDSALAGKPIICVAAAGGTGGGTSSCLEQMNRLIGHLRASKWDLITATQKSRPYKPDAIKASARAMLAALAD